MKFIEKLRDMTSAQKTILTVLSVCLVGTSAYVISKKLTTGEQESTESYTTELEGEDNLPTEVVSKGISVKYVASYTNDNGDDVKVVSYQLHPNNSTYTEVTASAEFKSGGSCSNFLGVEVDLENQYIILTNYDYFSEQIVVTITSVKYPSISAQLLVDQEKKLCEITGFNKYDACMTNPYTQCASLDTTGKYYLLATYSDYTVDKVYTATMTDFQCDAYKTNLVSLPDDWDTETNLAEFDALVEETFMSSEHRKPTLSELKEAWSCSFSNQDLYNTYTNWGQILCKITFKVKINENDDVYTLKNIDWVFRFDKMYTEDEINEFYVPLTSISFETGNVVF